MPKTLKIGQRSIILPNLATLVKPAKVALTNYFRMKDTADEILNHFLLHKKIKKRFFAEKQQRRRGRRRRGRPVPIFKVSQFHS